jgi:hypothetical protein
MLLFFRLVSENLNTVSIVIYVCNTSMWELQKDLEFEASLGYTDSLSHIDE